MNVLLKSTTLGIPKQKDAPIQSMALRTLQDYVQSHSTEQIQQRWGKIGLDLIHKHTLCKAADL